MSSIHDTTRVNARREMRQRNLRLRYTQSKSLRFATLMAMWVVALGLVGSALVFAASRSTDLGGFLVALSAIPVLGAALVSHKLTVLMNEHRLAALVAQQAADRYWR